MNTLSKYAKTNRFIILRKMKINKTIEFVSLETVFIEIERSKVSVSAFIIFKNMDYIACFVIIISQ